MRCRHTSMMRRALLTDCSVEKEKRASTSVETLPGTILRISLPNWTRRLSSVTSILFSRSVPCFLPYSTAASISDAYSGFLEAARMSEGLVVASWGWYFLMVAKSPESATTVCRRRWCQTEQFFRCRRNGVGVRATYRAGGLELVERAGHGGGVC